LDRLGKRGAEGYFKELSKDPFWFGQFNLARGGFLRETFPRGLKLEDWTLKFLETKIG